MSNVVELGCQTTLDIPPERILRKAIEADLETVLLVGRTKDGGLYFAGSSADGGDALWLMELAKHELMGFSS